MKQFINHILMKQLWQKLTSPLSRHIHHKWEFSREWKILQEQLNTSKRIIDLGCGANPHPRASVGVDAFLEPIHRALGMVLK